MSATGQDGRLTVSISETCRLSGLSRSKIYELIASGGLKTTHVGRRHLVYVTSLRSLLGEEAA